MPSIRGALEVVCEVFCQEDQWPPMIQAWKKLREDGLLPVSKGKAIVPATTEHLATLLLTVPALLYYRRSIHEVPITVKQYLDLTADDADENAAAFLTRLLDDEITLAKKSAGVPKGNAYTVRVYLDRPQIDYIYTVYADEQGREMNGPDSATASWTETCLYRPMNVGAEVPRPSAIRAVVDFPESAIRTLVQAWLNATDGSVE
jgi:hypothetical protein